MIKDLLLELLSIESYSGQEKALAEFIAKQLPGFEITRQTLAKNRYNLIAKKGKGKLWLVAHMDTVPGWIEPRISGGRLYGRGAVDNKGNIATAISVANEVEDINLCFTVGEEADFVGARAVASLIGDDLAIVMEPTGFQVQSAQRGALSFEVQTAGKREHSAYAKPGQSAILKLIELIKILESKHWTAFNVGLIEGGVAANVVPDSAKAVISVRPENMQEYSRIKKVIGKYKILNDMKPYHNPKIDGAMQKAFTEMAFFKNAFVWGVGNINCAHAADEHIILKDLEQAPAKLKALINKYQSK